METYVRYPHAHTRILILKIDDCDIFTFDIFSFDICISSCFEILPFEIWTFDES